MSFSHPAGLSFQLHRSICLSLCHTAFCKFLNLEVQILQLCLFFKIGFALWRYLRFHINFTTSVSFSFFAKTAVRILLQIDLNLCITVGTIVILMILSLLMYEYEMSFHLVMSF